MHQKPTDEQLANRYLHHAPVRDQGARYEKVRASILTTAKVIREVTPCSPEQTRAFNALDEAMFLANAAIARHEVPKEFDPVTNECLYGVTECCCDCGEDYPRADLVIRDQIYCPKCRRTSGK